MATGAAVDGWAGRTLTLAVIALASLLLSGALAGASGQRDDRGTPAVAPGSIVGVAAATTATGRALPPPLARVDAASREAVVAVPLVAWAASQEAFLAAAGDSVTVGGGRTTRFTVEVEATIADRLSELVRLVEATLFDPRSWTAKGGHALQRVGDPARADIRVVLAEPATVDRACARIGLETRGHLSCWDGRRVMLNAWRFDHGAAHFDSLAEYRGYLVNHEVGHGLGYDHVGCPGTGVLAPLMMQQTKGVGACLPNPWPHP